MSCKGEPIELQDLVTPDQAKLKKMVMEMLQSKVGQNATPLPDGMPISAPTNPMSLYGANLLAGLMGQSGYQEPQGTPYQYGGFPGYTPPPFTDDEDDYDHGGGPGSPGSAGGGGAGYGPRQDKRQRREPGAIDPYSARQNQSDPGQMADWWDTFKRNMGGGR